MIFVSFQRVFDVFLLFWEITLVKLTIECKEYTKKANCIIYRILASGKNIDGD